MTLETYIPEVKVFIPKRRAASLPRTPEAIAQRAFLEYEAAYAETEGRHNEAVLLMNREVWLVRYADSGVEAQVLHQGKKREKAMPYSVRRYVKKTGLVISKNRSSFGQFKRKFHRAEIGYSVRFQLYKVAPNPEAERAVA